MRTEPDQGQIGPLLRRGIFLSGTVRADFFVLPDSSSFWSHFSAANWKTTKFSFKIFCRCAELPTCQTNGFCEGKRQGTGFVLFSALEASSSFQQTIEKKRPLCHVAFLPKNRHLSLVPTLSGYALKVSWSWSKLALKSATKFFACVSYFVCLPRREKASVSHSLPPLHFWKADTMLETQNRKAWCQWREGHVQETIAGKEFVWLAYLIYRWLIRRSERQCGGNVGRSRRDLFRINIKKSCRSANTSPTQECQS